LDWQGPRQETSTAETSGGNGNRKERINNPKRGIPPLLTKQGAPDKQRIDSRRRFNTKEALNHVIDEVSCGTSGDDAPAPKS
jgi:hypothetical protein